MRLLCFQKTVISQNDLAADLAKHFLQSYCFIYGKGNVSYNVHSIIHLANDAIKYGVLDNFSAFPFENYLQHVKKIIQSDPAPLVQLYNRIEEEQACLSPHPPMNRYPYLDGQHVNGPLPFDEFYNKAYSQYSTLIMKDFTIRVSNEKRRSMKKDDCIIISSNNICIVYNILKINEEIYLVCKSSIKISVLFTTLVHVLLLLLEFINVIIYLTHYNYIIYKKSNSKLVIYLLMIYYQMYFMFVRYFILHTINCYLTIII